MQMAQHAANHSRYTSNAFKKYVPDHVFPFCHCISLFSLPSIGPCERDSGLVLVASDQVKAPTEQTNGDKGSSVGPVLDFAVGHFDISHLLFGVAWDHQLVYKSMKGTVDIHRMRPGSFRLADLFRFMSRKELFYSSRSR